MWAHKEVRKVSKKLKFKPGRVGMVMGRYMEQERTYQKDLQKRVIILKKQKKRLDLVPVTEKTKYF